VSESKQLLTDADLDGIERRCVAASKSPWEAFIEGRDHWGGDNFIRVGGLDDSEADMYVSRSVGGRLTPASDGDLDFVAHARRDIPRLMTEIRALKLSGHERSTTTEGRIMRTQHEPPENELPSVMATPELTWRGDGIVLAIPALMIYTTGIYLLVLYRTAHTQAKTIEHARTAADKLRELRANGRPVTLLGGEHRDYGFTYRAWIPFSSDNSAAVASDAVTFELGWPDVDQMSHLIQRFREESARAITLW
jgi:hypothetical protein